MSASRAIGRRLRADPSVDRLAVGLLQLKHRRLLGEIGHGALHIISKYVLRVHFKLLTWHYALRLYTRQQSAASMGEAYDFT
jgi:hypothetical protein